MSLTIITILQNGQGPAGAPGSTGATGGTGATGATGPQGPAGNPGSNLQLGVTDTTAHRGDLGTIAHTHSQVVHAPANAQKNSDITKAEIEAKLIGEIASHTHAGGLALGETSLTAYRGDRGKTAYDHSQIDAGNPHGTVIEDIDNLRATLDAKIYHGQNGEASFWDWLDVGYLDVSLDQQYYTTIILSSRSTDAAYLDAKLELDASQYAGLKKGTNYFRVTNTGYTVALASAFRTAIGAGTSSFDPASPGPIGGTTPGAGAFTTGTFTGFLKLGIKTIATLPSAASSSGERYQVSNSATIVNRIAFSNGSAWYYEGTAVAV